MFDIGGSEFLFLILLGLLIFGPQKLGQMGKKLGTLVGQLRQGMREFQSAVEREGALEDVKQAARSLTEMKEQVVANVTREVSAVQRVANEELAALAEQAQLSSGPNEAVAEAAIEPGINPPRPPTLGVPPAPPREDQQ